MLAPLGFSGEAPTEAEAHGGSHQDAEVGGHEPDGIGDVLQVQPVGAGRARWWAGEGRCQAGKAEDGGPRCWRQGACLPRDPHVPGEDFPGTACGERRGGRGQAASTKQPYSLRSGGPWEPQEHG